jgi:two-component system response regulator FixJ
MRHLVHLVEDDPVVRTMLARLLESGGYSVRQYASGDDILKAAEGLEEGCILLDINMPEPDGFAVQRELSRKAVELPVVMMSGSGDLTVLAMKAGVTEFMQKPFGRSELLDVLGQLRGGQGGDV